MPQDSYQTISTKAGDRIAAATHWVEAQRRFLVQGEQPETPPVPFIFLRFELSTVLSPSSDDTPTTCNGYGLYWSDTEEDYAADTSTEFKLIDLSGVRHGRAYAASARGGRGWAVKPHDVGIAAGGDRWEIIELDWMAKVIEFSVDNASGFDTSDETVAVTVDSYDDGYDPDPGGDGLTIYNKLTSTADTYLFKGDDDDKGIARFYPKLGYYRIWQMECPD